jgi:hypothetical protein
MDALPVTGSTFTTLPTIALFSLDEFNCQLPFNENTPPVVLVGILFITSHPTSEVANITTPSANENAFLIFNNLVH